MRGTTPSLTTSRRTGCGTLHMTLAYHHETHKSLTVMFTLGKSGGCASSQLNTIQVLINYLIKLDADLSELFANPRTGEYSLRGIRCPEVMADDEEFVEAPDEKLNLSCGDVIGKTLRYLLGKLEEMKPKKK